MSLSNTVRSALVAAALALPPHHVWPPSSCPAGRKTAAPASAVSIDNFTFGPQA